MSFLAPRNLPTAWLLVQKKMAKDENVTAFISVKLIAFFNPFSCWQFVTLKRILFIYHFSLAKCITYDDTDNLYSLCWTCDCIFELFSSIRILNDENSKGNLNKKYMNKNNTENLSFNSKQRVIQNRLRNRVEKCQARDTCKYCSDTLKIDSKFFIFESFTLLFVLPPFLP